MAEALGASDPPLGLALLGGANPSDLSSNPALASLLRDLNLRLGLEGQSLSLQKELREAEAAQELQRETWLRWESLWRLIQELLRQPGHLEPSELQALEQALSWAQLSPPSPSQVDPSLSSRLLLPLETRLADKVSSLVDFHGRGDVLPVPPSAPSLGLAGLLGEEKRRLEEEEEKRSRMEALLGTQQRACLEALREARSLLTSLLGPGYAGAQAELDRHRGDYLGSKGVAVMLRIRLEELSLLLDTYPGPKLEAHRLIRSRLERLLEEAGGRLPGLRSALGALRDLGPVFAASAAEYGRLRQRLSQRQWALRQLRGQAPPPP